MPCFIVFYGTGPGMCCLNEIGRARNVRLVAAARVSGTPSSSVLLLVEIVLMFSP